MCVLYDILHTSCFLCDTIVGGERLLARGRVRFASTV